jgi:hypothetical protein
VYKKAGTITSNKPHRLYYCINCISVEIMGYIKTLFLSSLLVRTVPAAILQLSRVGWTATSDSFKIGNEPSKAIDNNVNSFWSSNYNPDDPLPNYITIDMQSTRIVTSVSIQPRQDSPNGRFGEHRIELSTDGTNWNTPVAVGTFVSCPRPNSKRFTTDDIGVFAYNAQYMSVYDEARI